MASFATAALAVGAHSVTAVYSGDGNTVPSTSPAVTQTVNKVAASVTLTSSANPSNFGQAVTFTAKVAPSSATGVVQFMDGTALLGTSPVNGAAATFSTPALSAGTHSITAVYTGDTNDAAATSAPVVQTVNKVVVGVALATSAASALLGAAVTFTARVTPTSATGAVTFLDGGAAIGSGGLNGGTATFTTSALAVGTHTVTASYAGDGNNAAGVSAPVAQTIIRIIIGSQTLIPTSPIILQTISPVLTVGPLLTARPVTPILDRTITDIPVTDT